MKRSEMIQILADQFLIRGMASKNGSLIAAEEILELIESKEMQPPTITVLKDSYNRSEGCMGFEVNEWEPENE